MLVILTIIFKRIIFTKRDALIQRTRKVGERYATTR